MNRLSNCSFESIISVCVHFANKFLNDPEEAQEVVQDMFVKIWEARDDIDPENSLKSYVFKTVQNLSINKLTKKKSRVKIH